jgi:hypothetical protein
LVQPTDADYARTWLTPNRDAGLDLQSAAALVGEGPARARLMRGVAELDGVIRELRETVFDPGGEADAAIGAREKVKPDER